MSLFWVLKCVHTVFVCSYLLVLFVLTHVFVITSSTGSQGIERLHAARQSACEGTAETHAKFKGGFFLSILLITGTKKKNLLNMPFVLPCLFNMVFYIQSHLGDDLPKMSRSEVSVRLMGH